jgi:ligand-binding sensor domain-containing protein
LPELFRLVTPIDEVLPGAISALRPSADGGLWLLTHQGVAKLVDSTWNVYLTDFTGKLAGIDAAGRVWVVSEDTHEISAWDGDSWTIYRTDAGWTPLADASHRYVGWVQSDELGRLWLATSQDVRVFDAAHWKVFTPEDMGMVEGSGEEEFTSSFQLTIMKSTGEVWVRTCLWGVIGPAGGQGIRRFDGQTWQGVNPPADFQCVTEIAQDWRGRVWVGAEGRLWRYDPAAGDWMEFTGLSGAYAVRDIVFDPSDEPWVILSPCGASCYEGDLLYRPRDGDWIQVAPMDETYPHMLVFDAAGTPWLFWGGAIHRIVEDVPELVSLLYARSVTVDAAGRLWFVAQHQDRDTLWVLDTETGE